LAVYTATTRARQAPDANVFTSGRARQLNFARFTLSIPPTHTASNIEWPKAEPNPATDFVVTDQTALAQPEFLADVAADRMHKPGAPQRTIGIFVHGYNYNFQESLFRLAQMAADADIDSTPILFAWPSQGSITGYVADREAVTYSRDYLADLLVSLGNLKNGDDILLFGHSMGSFLIMEALRQLKLQGRTDLLAKLRVVLAAPDIDADVFRTQLAVIGKMPTPITMLVSKDDRALSASSLLDADHPRVGRLDINDPAIRDAAIDSGVRIIDISTLKATDAFRHDRYASLAKLGPQLVSLGDGPKQNPAKAVGSFVLDAAGATISSPFRLASRVINPQ
jgi:esterase/lipase superfamily enzyme